MLDVVSVCFGISLWQHLVAYLILMSMFFNIFEGSQFFCFSYAIFKPDSDTTLANIQRNSSTWCEDCFTPETNSYHPLLITMSTLSISKTLYLRYSVHFLHSKLYMCVCALCVFAHARCEVASFPG